MKGIQLSSLTGELHKVKRCGKNPAATISDADKKFGPAGQKYMLVEFEGKFSFPADCYKLPSILFKGFSFDELCKIHYSSFFTMDKSVTDLFKTSAQYEVIRKIQSSMWRWGVGKGTWNEVVEAYNNIRHFSFGHPDFELRLDHTTSYNPYGHSKYSQLFLDGVFAYLVYYKRKHVMTIGFSIQEGKHLLIQQVQTTAPTGNRWLYRLPSNRLEFVTELFRKNFPRYHIWVIDGGSLVEKTLDSYHEVLEKAERLKITEEIPILKKMIRHLVADRPRLIAFYDSVGRIPGMSKKINGILHHGVSFSSTAETAAA